MKYNWLVLINADGNDQVGREKLMIWEKDKDCWSNVLESGKGIRIVDFVTTPCS